TSPSEEAQVLCAKTKSRVAALIGSKSPQARWAGVVLAKCVLESSFEALAAWGEGWVRRLVGLVNRPEPTVTTVMLIRTLARVFTKLTLDRPTLTRELVTPHLPAFFGALVVAVTTPRGDDSVTACAWEALRDSVQAHPVTFRPFVGKTKVAVKALLDGRCVEQEMERVVRELVVALHLCGPAPGSGGHQEGGRKVNAPAMEWTALFNAAVARLHSALDVLFEPVLEEYREGDRQSGGEEAEREIPVLADRVGLLLRSVGSFFTVSTGQQPQIPLGSLMNAVSRILSVSTDPASTEHNPAIEKSQRELLFSLFPAIHAQTFDMVDTVVNRLQSVVIPFVPSLLGHAVALCGKEGYNADLKVSIYNVTSTLLTLAGPALDKESTLYLTPLLQTCCTDLLAPRAAARTAPTTAPAHKKQKTNSTTHADSLLSTTPAAPKFTPPGLPTAAGVLLTTALSKLPSQHIRAELRVQLERTAILTGNRAALLAAVLFPRAAAERPGTVPFLVGAGVDAAAEALVRPRMPVVWTGPSREEVRRALEEEKEARELEMEE
ncbi:rRNA processing/ribosome biogenesis-domain-containing protein, partial [Tricharina praecox]|uniref:rRNA processing/ribosome biogenesis-domain-containing protein n=1 Tax=Tricharina praecox TaxID=43433 RepID=UPI00221EDC50